MLVHGIPFESWIRLSYAERHVIDPKGWPMEQNNAPQIDPSQAAMATLALVPEVMIEGGGETSKAQAALEKLRAFPVFTAEQIAIAGDLLQHLKGEWDRLETRRTSFTQPLLAVKYSIDELFKPALSALKEGEVVLKEKIRTAQLSIQQANFEAQQKAQALLQVGDARGAALASSALQTTQAPVGIQYRDVWKYRIVDASIIPKLFLKVDEQKIAAHVKIHGANSNIPGVEVSKDVQVVAGKK